MKKIIFSFLILLFSMHSYGQRDVASLVYAPLLISQGTLDLGNTPAQYTRNFSWDFSQDFQEIEHLEMSYFLEDASGNKFDVFFNAIQDPSTNPTSYNITIQSDQKTAIINFKNSGYSSHSLHIPECTPDNDYLLRARINASGNMKLFSKPSSTAKECELVISTDYVLGGGGTSYVTYTYNSPTNNGCQASTGCSFDNNILQNYTTNPYLFGTTNFDQLHVFGSQLGSGATAPSDLTLTCPGLVIEGVPTNYTATVNNPDNVTLEYEWSTDGVNWFSSGVNNTFQVIPSGSSSQTVYCRASSACVTSVISTSITCGLTSCEDLCQDQDWLTVPNNDIPNSLEDAIYTNNRIGINFENAVDAMLYVNIPWTQHFTPGWNTLLDASNASTCRDNLLLKMGDECEWSTAMEVEMGSNATAVIYGAGYANFAGTWIWSDRKFKSNINSVSSALDKVMALDGKQYDFKVSEGAEVMPTYGFIAQDVLRVVPELSRQMPTGSYAVNYDGFIPILTEAIKEQQKQIESKDQQIADLENTLKDLASAVEEIKNDLENICKEGCVGLSKKESSSKEALEIPVYLRTAWLGQNYPNPHSGGTSIQYFVPEGAQSAALRVVDLQGKLIRSQTLDINLGDVEFKDANLASGVYLYSLLVDNIVVDSKRMSLKK